MSTAEVFIQVLGYAAGALILVYGSIVGLINLLRRMGLDTRKRQREDSVDTSSTESALQMLKQAREELDRKDRKIAELEDRANNGMQRELALTRKLAVAEANVERLNRTLVLVAKAEKDLIAADQLGDRLVDGLTNIIVETSGNQ